VKRLKGEVPLPFDEAQQIGLDILYHGLSSRPREHVIITGIRDKEMEN
jgi:hypothetical protein